MPLGHAFSLYTAQTQVPATLGNLGGTPLAKRTLRRRIAFKRVIFSYTRQTKTPALRLGGFARTLVRSECYEEKEDIYSFWHAFSLYTAQTQVPATLGNLGGTPLAK